MDWFLYRETSVMKELKEIQKQVTALEQDDSGMSLYFVEKATRRVP